MIAWVSLTAWFLSSACYALFVVFSKNAAPLEGEACLHTLPPPRRSFEISLRFLVAIITLFFDLRTKSSGDLPASVAIILGLAPLQSTLGDVCFPSNLF